MLLSSTECIGVCVCVCVFKREKSCIRERERGGAGERSIGDSTN